jgi:hypothetical protein
VNERKRPRSAQGKRSAVHLDAQTTELRASGSRSIARARANSIIVFCGDAQQVRDGFALALDAMEANADSLMMGTELLPKGK